MMHVFNFRLILLAVACVSGLVHAQEEQDSTHQKDGRAHIKYGDDYRNAPRHGDRYGPGFEKYYADDYYGDDHNGDDYYGDDGYGYHDYGYRRVVCEKLSDPQNGSVKQRGIYKGSKAVYSCDEGHILTGVKVRVCKRNGNFSDDAPTCQPVECGQPPSPENGAVQVEDTTFGNTANQSCNEGYDFNGDVTRKCLASGMWSGDVAQCTPVDCGDPEEADANGSVDVSDGTTLGSTAVYSCAAGYNLVGSDVVTCTVSGEWSDGAPTCQIVDCGSPDDPDDNGSVNVTTTTVGSTADYTCNEGYILVGSETVTCQADGTWSDQTAPVCNPVDCGDPEEADANGSVDVSDGTTLGSTAVYSCAAGYNLVGSDVVTCTVSGEWSDGAPTCQIVDCGSPDDPDDNGSVNVTTTTVGSTADYTCNEGYNLVGSDVVTCTVSGDWSDGAPTCQIVDCGSPDDPDDNGSVNVTTTTVGSTADYTCNEGYILVGSETVTCQADGTWSDQTAPVCNPVDCGDPEEADANGSVDVSDGTTLGSTAVYSCAAGYNLVGSDVVTCTVSGLWSDGAPTCRIVDCGELSAPENGKIVTEPDTTYNSVVTYSCKRGFKLVGDEERTCEANGAWSGDSPVCKKTQCPKLEPPKYGKIYIYGYYPGHYVVYRCGYGYDVERGSQRRVCQYSGNWSGTDVVCNKSPADYGYPSHHRY